MASDITQRLRVLRAELNISQETVAKGVGMNLKAYNSIENGKSVPSMTNLVLLADYFKVSVDWLIGRTEKREV